MNNKGADKTAVVQTGQCFGWSHATKSAFLVMRPKYTTMQLPA